MNAETLKDTFYTLVAPDLPNEWDVDEAIEPLVDIGENQCKSVLDQVPVIWPVSHSLCFDYLKMVVAALDCIETNTISEWVNSTLDQYEKDGLRAAQRYMADVKENFLCKIQGKSGLQFKQVSGKLLPYLRGLSGRPLELVPSNTVYTDTSTVYVPHDINMFRDDADNFFIYKLIVSFQWAYIALSSYTFFPQEYADSGETEKLERIWLAEWLDQFSCYELARDLYHFLETVRAGSFLEKELPGLMRRKRGLFTGERIRGALPSEKTSILSCLSRVMIDGDSAAGCHLNLDPFLRKVKDFAESADSPQDSIAAVQELYPLILAVEKEYIPLRPPVFQGHVDLEAVQRARNLRLKELKEVFVDRLSTRLLSLLKPTTHGEEEHEGEVNDSSGTAGERSDIALVIDTQKYNRSERFDQTLVATLNNEEVELGDDLYQTAADIIDELGCIPEHYISSASGKAGKGYASFVTSGNETGEELFAPIIYDEWDYRRSDFRKNWCSVIEKKIPLNRSTFLHKTLTRYHGQIVRLRYQFEMMRTSERFVRRQRDGEDIDLDALVESISDTKAGLPASDRLFVRLKRDERDIAVLFLIDMSNSTQGWVGQVIKESLILLCEALEVVGDSYAIYGFSGMRRLRSEFFHIKHIDEPYNDAVKERIVSITPREYTRMGSAVRHATSLLTAVDSRVRLLITLTDGKPEDYDDYKGEYAIEDTRHALFEARAAGVHPFCITIDSQAHDYISHMFGELNYILIDDVRRLPQKMPEIYRVLTN